MSGSDARLHFKKNEGGVRGEGAGGGGGGLGLSTSETLHLVSVVMND